MDCAATEREKRGDEGEAGAAAPGGAKPGHEGHSRTLAQDPDRGGQAHQHRKRAQRQGLILQGPYSASNTP